MPIERTGVFAFNGLGLNFLTREYRPSTCLTGTRGKPGWKPPAERVSRKGPTERRWKYWKVIRRRESHERN
ncbi:hypothetical protein ACFL2E_05305 [Thermodesulfobacteriota bacterium]